MHCRTTKNTTIAQNCAFMAGIRKVNGSSNWGAITLIDCADTLIRLSAALLVDFSFELPALLSLNSYTKRKFFGGPVSCALDWMDRWY